MSTKGKTFFLRKKVFPLDPLSKKAALRRPPLGGRGGRLGQLGQPRPAPFRRALRAPEQETPCGFLGGERERGYSFSLKEYPLSQRKNVLPLLYENLTKARIRV